MNGNAPIVTRHHPLNRTRSQRSALTSKRTGVISGSVSSPAPDQSLVPAVSIVIRPGSASFQAAGLRLASARHGRFTSLPMLACQRKKGAVIFSLTPECALNVNKARKKMDDACMES